MLKRIFDTFFSFFGLVLTLPLLIIIAILIRLDSKGPVFYRGVRVGQFGKQFKIFKFRTMVEKAEELGGPSTSADDPRLTKFGRFLRKYKLDELPQLINVLRGEMSLVGPRPEVPEEIATYSAREREILKAKPGMTDFASLWDFHEEEILRGSKNPHQTYREKIKPMKIKLSLEYLEKQSFLTDLKIIFLTIKKLFKE